ncbi:hypothetical protein RJT34_04729 [Clitoria ternatea]|uniref:Uncharacterized protein n=1 Tax=Clitoria ternatea TaxID=43366 RepID=A0AAN9Q0T9_CLITE
MDIKSWQHSSGRRTIQLGSFVTYFHIYTLWRVTLSFPWFKKSLETFCFSAIMDIKSWQHSSGRRTIQLGRCSNEIDHVNSLSAIGSTKLKWKLLWIKLKKEKKKLFDCTSAKTSTLQVPYDPYTYSQNFDHGTALDEPENLSRSFSVRFADPSRVIVNKKGVVSKDFGSIKLLVEGPDEPKKEVIVVRFILEEARKVKTHQGLIMRQYLASSEHFVCFAVPEKEVEAVAEALQFVFYSALNVRRLS